VAASLISQGEAPAFGSLAQAAAHRLCSQAIWHEGRCTWMGDEAVEGEAQTSAVIHRSRGADLYGGTSGIAWFLAQAWRRSGDDEIARTARGAARHAIRQVAEDGALFTGAGGVALALEVVGRLLSDAELLEEANRLVERLSGQNASGIDGWDLISGRAGAILALLGLWALKGDERALTRAVCLGDELIAGASRRHGGWSWAGPPGEPALCGMGHGAAGVALALGELGEGSGEARFLEAALEALRYERSWFSRQVGNWPDLREFERSVLEQGGGPSYAIHWCHGASGAGIARLRLYQRTGDRLSLSEAAAAVDTATSTMLRTLATARRPTAHRYEANFSLCHGVASVIELHLIALDVTGDEEHLVHAQHLASAAFQGPAGIELGSGPAQIDPSFLMEQLACGVYGGSETPGLMLGTAGFGTAFLRLQDVKSLPSPLLPCDWAACVDRPISA
jgi:lantibiotic modifying enzyme